MAWHNNKLDTRCPFSSISIAHVHGEVTTGPACMVIRCRRMYLNLETSRYVTCEAWEVDPSRSFVDKLNIFSRLLEG